MIPKKNSVKGIYCYQYAYMYFPFKNWNGKNKKEWGCEDFTARTKIFNKTSLSNIYFQRILRKLVEDFEKTFSFIIQLYFQIQLANVRCQYEKKSFDVETKSLRNF